MSRTAARSGEGEVPATSLEVRERLVEALTPVLRGVRFIVDDRGEKTGVVIALKDNAELWDDICDRAIARRRAREPRVSLKAVKSGLRRLGKLSQ